MAQYYLKGKLKNMTIATGKCQSKIYCEASFLYRNIYHATQDGEEYGIAEAKNSPLNIKGIKADAIFVIHSNTILMFISNHSNEDLILGFDIKYEEKNEKYIIREVILSYE